MSARAVFVMALLGIATLECRAPGSDRLEGRWIGVRAEGVGAEGLPAANAFATGTVLEFRRNEIIVTTSKESQYGRYQVVREDANTVSIATDRDGPGHPQTFTFGANDTMRWSLPDGKWIVFARP